MLGIGCNGFDGEEYIGVVKPYIDWFLKKIQDPNMLIPTAFLALDFSKAKRYNQWDAFMSSYAGTDLQATAVGKAKKPLTDMIQA
jgi:hypothetical protein